MGRRTGRVLLAASTVVLAVAAVGLVGLLAISNTGWGRERVRRIALGQLRGRIHGQASIGRVTGNLLIGMTVHDLAIRDSAGAPFIVADEVSLDYRLLSLLRRRLYFDDVRVVRPLVVLDHPPEGMWNYKRIFAADTTRPSTGPNAWTRHIQLTDVTVVDGHLIVRSPWHPDEELAPAVRDSTVREVLGGGSRLLVVAVPGGYQKIVELRQVNAKAPFVRLTDPSYDYRVARVASVNTMALPFRPPAAVVRDLRGEIRFDNDSVWWSDVYAELPASRVSGDGRYEFDDGDMTLELRGAPAALADMRWIYPRLPAEGEGTLDFLLRWDGATESYIARNVSIRSGNTRVRGSFGFTLADTFAIHDTDLRIANLDTRMIEQLVPGFDSPRRGTVSGTVKLAGGRNAMRLDGDIAFDDQRDGSSHVVADGLVGFGRGVRMSDLRLRLAPLQVELARGYLKDMPISGALTGTVMVSGSTRTQLAVRGDIRHSDRGAVSNLTGRATMRLAGSGRRSSFDADVMARSLSLVEAGRFVPSVGLVGWASGPIHVTGTPDDLRFRADLRLPAGGALDARGSVSLAGPRTGYDLVAAMRVVNLRTVIAKAPETSLTARVAARGSGFAAATMRSTIATDFAASSWDSLAVDSGSVRVTIADGLADVRRLFARGRNTLVEASGTVGLSAAREGTLSYRVAVDSLGALARWIPVSGADTGVVRPRPERVRRAVARARADSARAARATEVERAISGAPAPGVAVEMPAGVPRNVLGGSLYAAGTVHGNLKRFDVRGRASGDSVYVRGNSVHRFRSEYAWTDARTPRSTLAVGLQADTLSVGGFGFDSVDARLGYHAPDGQGRVEVVVRQGENRDYSLKGDFVLLTGANQLRVADLTLRFDTTRWVSTHPTVVDWRGTGMEIHSLELRDGGVGRVYVNGVLPTEGVADFQLAADNVEVGNLVALLQSDVEAQGLVSLSGRMQGTLRAPELRGAFGVGGGVYRGTTLPELHGTFAYADRRLAAHLDALREGGEPMMVADGQLPLNLALAGVSGSRLLDLPLTLDVTADSLPLELLPYFTDAVSDVSGLAVGRVAVRGTLDRPSIIGGLALARASATIASTGMRIADIGGSVRMLNDSIYVDSIAGQSFGDVFLRGTVAVGDWRTPSFNLYLVAHDAEVLRNDHGRLRADAGLALTGSLERPYLSGQVTVTQGVVYVPNPTSKHVISAGDPALFAVVDTSMDSERELFPSPSPFVRNARIDVALAVNRNTWARSKDMNIEVFTEYPVSVRSRNGELALVGTVTTDRGEYSFLSKRFQISRGSATFIGGSEINPTLQVTGEYQVQLTSAPAMTIKVLIGGTMKRPRLSLESDAQPPRTQSELLTLLAFGRSTSNLLQPEGNAFTGAVSPGELVGIGASLAVRRLAGIAMGVAIQELETEAGRGIGADVFDITPADVPSNIEGGSTIGSFLQDTKVEVGKYLNTRTFLGLQGQGQVVGARLQYRTGSGWLYQTYWEPRYLLREPSLSGQVTIPTSAMGAFVVRAWRF